MTFLPRKQLKAMESQLKHRMFKMQTLKNRVLFFFFFAKIENNLSLNLYNEQLSLEGFICQCYLLYSAILCLSYLSFV